MRVILSVGLAVAFVSSVGIAEDKKDEKIDGKKLVGKWELVDRMTNLVVEYTADGKWFAELTVEGIVLKMDGTYKLDGDKLAQTRKINDRDETRTVTLTKLTDEVMEGENTKGMKNSFKRLKK